MDERSASPLLTPPGHKNIGVGRHFRGLGVTLWLLNGVVYVTLLFVTLLVVTGLWKRIIPTSWEIVPQAIESLQIYLGFGVPTIEHFQPDDATGARRSHRADPRARAQLDAPADA